MKTVTILFFVLSGICSATIGSEPDDQVDGEVVRVVSKLLIEHHLQRKGIDKKKRSRDWAREYLLTLDPQRMHFLNSDVTEFMKKADLVLTDAQNGNVEFAHLVAQRFRQRFDANAVLISKLLEAEHDFTAEETVRFRHEDYAIGKLESDERWRLRVKHELLIESPHDPGSDTARKFLLGRYSRIQRHIDSLTQSNLLILYIESLARTFDSRSAYYDSHYFTRMFRVSHVGSYTIGLRFELRDGDLWILPSSSKSPTMSQLAGCRIVAVRLEGKKPIHLSGLTDRTAILTLASPISELGNARTVILDVDDPKRGKRIVVVADRWLPGR